MVTVSRSLLLTYVVHTSPTKVSFIVIAHYCETCFPIQLGLKDHRDSQGHNLVRLPVQPGLRLDTKS